MVSPTTTSGKNSTFKFRWFTHSHVVPNMFFSSVEHTIRYFKKKKEEESHTGLNQHAGE